MPGSGYSTRYFVNLAASACTFTLFCQFMSRPTVSPRCAASKFQRVFLHTSQEFDMAHHLLTTATLLWLTLADEQTNTLAMTLSWQQRKHWLEYLCIICPIVIAYSMGQIIKSLCVCVSVCVSVRLRALSRSHFLIDFYQNWHRRKNPQK